MVTARRKSPGELPEPESFHWSSWLRYFSVEEPVFMITAEEAEYGTEEPHSSGSDVGLHPWEEQQLYSYHREQMLLGNTEQLQRRRIEAFGLEASAEMAERCKAPPGPPRPTETAASSSSTPPTVSQDIREEDVQTCRPGSPPKHPENSSSHANILPIHTEIIMKPSYIHPNIIRKPPATNYNLIIMLL